MVRKRCSPRMRGSGRIKREEVCVLGKGVPSAPMGADEGALCDGVHGVWSRRLHLPLGGEWR